MNQWRDLWAAMMEVTITQSGSVEWDVLAVLLTGLGGAWLAFHQFVVMRRDSVQPVVWVRAARFDSDNVLQVLVDNMGVGPAANCIFSFWLIPIDGPLDAKNQIAQLDDAWPDMRDTEPATTFGRPIPAATTMRRFSSPGPIDGIGAMALGVYTYAVTDVHGRTHTGVRLAREWRKLWRRRAPRPGTVIVPRSNTWPDHIDEL